MKPQVTSIGLGYIGLPTSALIANNNIAVHGVDINQHAVDTINAGKIHIIEPCGFDLNDSRFKRVVMDYIGLSKIFRYEDYDMFLKKNKIGCHSTNRWTIGSLPSNKTNSFL